MASMRIDFGGTIVMMALILLPDLPLAAQYQRPNQKLSPEEEAAIEASRKSYRPRRPLPSGALLEIERARARVFATAKDSVVYISSYTSKATIIEKSTGNEYALPPGTGTGFVWDGLGHVVTNHHVLLVEDEHGVPRLEAEDLRVTLANGKKYRARVVGRSLMHDIAVLRVFAPLKDMKPIPLGTSKDIQVGQSVLAIGNPWGLDHTMTNGIISALGRDIALSPYLGSRIRGAIQTDAAINPGNSGGPLLDSGGRLIGMNTTIQSTTGSSAGIGFAIPADTLNRIVPVLIAKGQIERPELGFQTIPFILASRLFQVTKGVVVLEVQAGSTAERAGLRGLQPKPGIPEPKSIEDMLLGDVIVGFKGKPIESDVELMDLLELEPPETPLIFDVLRGDQRIKVTLRPGFKDSGGPKA